MNQKTTEAAVEQIYQFLACSEQPDVADVIIAFGSYHKPVAKTAANLILQQDAPILICTGNSSALTKDLVTTTEADFFADIAIECGVKPDQIIRERKATNTGENIAFSLSLLAKHGVYPKTVLACAMPMHLRRIITTFAKQAPEIHVIPILVPFEFSEYRTKEGMSFDQRLLAEIDRLRSYPSKGFTIPTLFPEEIILAERVLRLSK